MVEEDRSGRRRLKMREKIKELNSDSGVAERRIIGAGLEPELGLLTEGAMFVSGAGSVASGMMLMTGKIPILDCEGSTRQTQSRQSRCLYLKSSAKSSESEGGANRTSGIVGIRRGPHLVGSCSRVAAQHIVLLLQHDAIYGIMSGWLIARLLGRKDLRGRSETLCD